MRTYADTDRHNLDTGFGVSLGTGLGPDFSPGLRTDFSTGLVTCSGLRLGTGLGTGFGTGRLVTDEWRNEYNFHVESVERATYKASACVRCGGQYFFRQRASSTVR